MLEGVVDDLKIGDPAARSGVRRNEWRCGRIFLEVTGKPVAVYLDAQSPFPLEGLAMSVSKTIGDGSSGHLPASGTKNELRWI